MGGSPASLIEMFMCDAAFDDFPCHHAIRVPQGYMVVCTNDTQ